jgi:hypothetical protein
MFHVETGLRIEYVVLAEVVTTDSEVVPNAGLPDVLMVDEMSLVDAIFEVEEIGLFDFVVTVVLLVFVDLADV